ncbi:NAD(P)/FAD-dependent oxidoreductase [Nanoarchaeota archaeon]
MIEVYDLIIIGAGAAGMSAAIYAARYKINVAIISTDVGGLSNEAHLVENWPGVISKSGLELMGDFKKHVEQYDVPIIEEEVTSIKKDVTFTVQTKKNEYQSKTIIFALGTKRRKLNVPGEEDFAGKGVSYCFTCDGPLFKDKTVAMVGGGDAAGTGALMLAEYAKKVYLIVRSDLKAEPVTIDNIKKNPKIEIILNSTINEILGEALVNKIKLNDGKELDVDGVFIEVGHIPSTTLAKEVGVELSNHNEIKVNDEMKTNVEGLFSAGDITDKSAVLRQIVTAAAQGAIASLSVFKYLKQ